MQEIEGNIWDHHAKSRWIVITTNGNISLRTGCAIMGKGIAEQAAIRFPNLPARLGAKLEEGGNKVYWFDDLKIITVPTKHNWRQKASLELIEDSLKDLAKAEGHGKFYLPRLGCGEGKLDWNIQVKPLCEKYLDDRFVVVHRKE
jgi:hypothetical protein